MDRDRYAKVREFAKKWLLLFKSEDTTPLQLENTSFARECDELGFEMDGGRAFNRKHNCASVSNEVMKAACKWEDDIDVLGSGIYSQWRDYTHWSQRDLTEPDIREWFKIGLERLLYLSCYPTFEGTAVKIVIESDDSNYCPPAPGQEIRQRLTLNLNGTVAFTRYFFGGDFSKVPPETGKDKKVMRRWRCKPTEKIMMYISEYFRKPLETKKVYDVGVWAISLENEKGEKWDYIGSFSDRDLEIHGFKLSQITRKVLKIPELWVFDGGVYPVIKAVKGDITKITDVEAIVNAANSSLLGGGGVDGAIHRAAGPKLLDECRTLGGCPTGEAKITKAYNLPCEYVIHTVGPVWHGGKSGEPELLASCYYNSLKIAQENGISKIAFPSISTGVYSYPIDKAAKIAVETVNRFMGENQYSFDVVEWVLFDDRTFEVYDAEIDKLYQE